MSTPTHARDCPAQGGRRCLCSTPTPSAPAGGIEVHLSDAERAAMVPEDVRLAFRARMAASKGPDAPPPSATPDVLTAEEVAVIAAYRSDYNNTIYSHRYVGEMLAIVDRLEAEVRRLTEGSVDDDAERKRRAREDENSSRSRAEPPAITDTTRLDEARAALIAFADAAAQVAK